MLRGEDYARDSPCFSICIPLLAHLVVLVKAADFSTLVSTIPEYRKFIRSMNTCQRTTISRVKPKVDYMYALCRSPVRTAYTAHGWSAVQGSPEWVLLLHHARARPIAGREPHRYACMDEAGTERARECAPGTLTGGHRAF